jgi:hypothetical protein
MRRIVLSLTSVLASSTLMFGVAAATGPSCVIRDTGPHSFNECTDTTTNKTTITCNNKVDVVFHNNQQASSGNSLVIDNTNGGSATSGNASNSNDTSANLDVSCGAKTATEVSPTPAPVPAPEAAPVAAPVAAQSAPTGGQGQGQGQAQGQAPKAQALPETGGNSALTTATIATVVVGMFAAVTRAGFSAYKFFNIK